MAEEGNINDQEWYQAYKRDVTASYRGYKYPRLYPASSLYLFFDRKEYEVLGHTLDLSRGLLTVSLQDTAEKHYYIHVFVSQDADVVYCHTVDAQGNAAEIFHHNEGGNDLVFYNLIGARLGILNLEQFKRHIRYCQMPNETAADRVTLSGGRVSDDRSLDYMSRMGIWVENFSLYAVVDECLLWGHTDVVELFPNWDLQKAAAFRSFRAKGAFLVDAACSVGAVEYVRVCSERGGVFKLKNPWAAAVDQNGKEYTDAVIVIPMEQGETLSFKCKSHRE